MHWSNETKVKHADSEVSGPSLTTCRDRNLRTCSSCSAEPVRLVLVPFSQTTGGLNKDWEKTLTHLEGETNQNIQHQNILMIENAVIAYKSTHPILLGTRAFHTPAKNKWPPYERFFVFLSQSSRLTMQHFTRTSFQELCTSDRKLQFIWSAFTPSHTT